MEQQKNFKHVKKNGSLYIADLLEQNIRNENIPQTELNIFLYNYYSSVCDAYVPYIKMDDNILSLSKDSLF